ncbi:ATP-grasp domain-containing protein [Aureivirga sp. CE67]|uniref:ATP-grasp domain-containing protein n=1 Tax=Aureivirga sp. CE67 TaxID=1788983 RepID=UPI0018C94045|nr:ATP-grasp domain-containing protein [Aureivirga sp. CE67]
MEKEGIITKALIHEYGNGKLEIEHENIVQVLESRDIPYELFTSKKLHRNQLKLNKNTLVVGDHSVMETVFKRLKFSCQNNSYPESLKPFLKRNVWESSLTRLFNESLEKDISDIFIKPKNKTKLFTGFVLNSSFDLFQLENYSKSTKLYCSEIVDWLSEFRVFVINSKIVGIKNYAGNPEIKLDLKEVEKAIKVFEKSDEKTAAYGIDFGVLSNGETALIEWNDGFALGSYNLEKEIYTDLIMTRWKEILSKSTI